MSSSAGVARCPITGATAAAGGASRSWLRSYAACIGGAVLLGAAAAGYYYVAGRGGAGKTHGDAPKKGESVFNDPNDPRDDEGRVHHLHVKEGDVANRVLSVGDSARAERIAKLFDGGKAKVVVAPRGFVTHTGTYNGVPV